MKSKILGALALSIALSGCVATVRANPGVAVEFEPDVIVGEWPIGYYDPAFGYWTGVGWDFDFYVYGHPGWGHCYRGCPGWAHDNWHHGGYHGHGPEMRPHR